MTTIAWPPPGPRSRPRRLLVRVRWDSLPVVISWPLRPGCLFVRGVVPYDATVREPDEPAGHRRRTRLVVVVRAVTADAPQRSAVGAPFHEPVDRRARVVVPRAVRLGAFLGIAEAVGNAPIPTPVGRASEVQGMMIASVLAPRFDLGCFAPGIEGSAPRR